MAALEVRVAASLARRHAYRNPLIMSQIEFRVQQGARHRGRQTTRCVTGGRCRRIPGGRGPSTGCAVPRRAPDPERPTQCFPRRSANTTSNGPSGALRRGSVGPKIAITGHPTPQARCIGPVSAPMNSAARRSRECQQAAGDPARGRHHSGARRSHGLQSAARRLFARPPGNQRQGAD